MLFVHRSHHALCVYVIQCNVCHPHTRHNSYKLQPNMKQHYDFETILQGIFAHKPHTLSLAFLSAVVILAFPIPKNPPPPRLEPPFRPIRLRGPAAPPKPPGMLRIWRLTSQYAQPKNSRVGRNSKRVPNSET